MVISRSLYAHHAMSLFDQKTVISVTGDVTEFNFSNPHATLFMDVKDSKGNVDKWVIEFGPPAQLKRDNHLNGDSFKVGDRVTMEGHPYKDGRKIMRPTKVVLANGQEVQNLY
jgi:hypothetical protein